MSHELRTPLNAIGGYVELLDLGIHGPLAEAQRGALARITANQRHLLTLINDILSFARLEAGSIEFDAAGALRAGGAGQRGVAGGAAGGGARRGVHVGAVRPGAPLSWATPSGCGRCC